MKPHLKKTWCIGKINAQFLAQMERVLWVYSQPYDPAHPVICFDERPCFLIGDVLAPLPLQTGQVAKEHYAYSKHGSCALLGAVEPLTGSRLAAVYPQRTKKEYAQFCQSIIAQWPEAQRIRLVQDNLNTHNASSFYEHLPADEAFAMSQKFEFIYTPKSASWLNMIEIEFSAISRACLDRRIPTIDKLTTEVLAIVRERDAKRIKLNWQFSIPAARRKLNSHYRQVVPENSKFSDT
ncbi:MAG: IS630 family transposase [Anaerolineae bacterium]|nr:IS630 family transposase [Anaerolineae bacterium]